MRELLLCGRPSRCRALPCSLSTTHKETSTVSPFPTTGVFLFFLIFFFFFSSYHKIRAMVVAGLGDSSLRFWDMRNQDTWKAKQPGAAVARYFPLFFFFFFKILIFKCNCGFSEKYHSLVGHGGPVYSASFSPCNRYLLSASEDSTVRLWGLETAEKASCLIFLF